MTCTEKQTVTVRRFSDARQCIWYTDNKLVCQATAASTCKSISLERCKWNLAKGWYVTTAINYQEKGEKSAHSLPCVYDETAYHYNYRTSDNNTRTARYKTTVCHTDWRKATATARQWRTTKHCVNRPRQQRDTNNALLSHLVAQTLSADNTNWKQTAAALIMNILYIQCATSTSFVSVLTPVNDI